MIEHYTIPLSNYSAEDLLLEWRWLAPMTLRPKWVTLFGDWFFEDENGRVQFLDLLDGRLTDLGEAADFHSEGNRLIEVYRSELSVDWVEICRQRGFFLGNGQCYGWKLHPIVGGRFEFENIQAFTLRVYESLMGQISRQVQARPSNFKITGFSLPSEES